MASIPGLFFIIVRRDQARFVRPDPENGLHTVGFVTLTDLRSQNADPGDARVPPASEHSDFLALLASRISEDFSADLFTDVVLVAPSDVLWKLMDLIVPATTASLLGTLARDLMSVPDLELWPHFLPWIQATEVNHTPGVASCEC